MANVIEQAYGLVNAGRVADGLALLESSGASGNAEALVELAVWRLEGRLVARDLARTREYFRLAAEAGHEQSRMIYIAFVASGTGGGADWPAAIELLRSAATTNPDAARQSELIAEMRLSDSGEPLELPESRPVSEQPWARSFPSLLTAGECRYLIEAALPSLQPATVVDPATGRLVPHSVRTSDNAAFPLTAETPFIHAINRRIAAASGTHVDCGEPLQVLRYRPGQQYRPHHDALPGADNQRILTMLVYLNSAYQGGETEFLSAGTRFKGAPGDALLFRNADSRGDPDPDARHAGLPVTSGEKLIASRWIRQRQFTPR